MSEALFQRLETFLGKMKEKQSEILKEAEVGFAGLREDFPDDPQPTGNAISAIKTQMMQLGQRIDEVWDTQISKLFEAQAPTEEDRARDRKDDARRELEETAQRFEVKVMADYYRALHPRAVEALRKPVMCTRCSAVVRPQGVRRIEAIPCPSCGAVAQVVPETAVGQYFGGAGHAFGEEAALPLRHAVDRYRVEVDRRRRAAGWPAESIESLERWEALEQAYWDRYGEVRAAASGDPVDTAFLQSRMEAFRRYGLEMDQRWRKHRGLV